jgi:hypothetical protein
MMRFKPVLAAICSVLVASSAWAHHSHGNYVDSFTDIEGTVKEVHLLLPHSWVYLEVKNPKAGDPEIWAIEATGRNGLERIGVTKETVAPGDTIKVRCHVLRDGSNGCLLGFMKEKSGTVRDWDGNNAALPSDF